MLLVIKKTLLTTSMHCLWHATNVKRGSLKPACFLQVHLRGRRTSISLPVVRNAHTLRGVAVARGARWASHPGVAIAARGSTSPGRAWRSGRSGSGLTWWSWWKDVQQCSEARPSWWAPKLSFCFGKRQYLVWFSMNNVGNIVKSLMQRVGSFTDGRLTSLPVGMYTEGFIYHHRCCRFFLHISFLTCNSLTRLIHLCQGQNDRTKCVCRPC